jgi:hypothetical protein
VRFALILPAAPARAVGLAVVAVGLEWTRVLALRTPARRW